MPFVTTLGAYKPLRSGYGAPLSENYVRYINSLAPATTTIGGTGGAYDIIINQVTDYDNSGNFYILLLQTDSAGSGNTNIIIEKYASDRTLLFSKTIDMSWQIDAVAMIVDKAVGIPYIAVSTEDLTGANHRMSIMALDSSLNVSWSNTYVSAAAFRVWIAKDPAQSYLYVFGANTRLFILNTSGTLQTAYTLTGDFPLIPSGASIPGGPVHISGTTLASGRSYVTLNAGLITINVTTHINTLTTANTRFGSSTHNLTDDKIYVTYYNVNTGVSGIYKTDFTNTISITTKYSFSGEPYALEFTGITNDGTYLYVSARSSQTTGATDISYMLRFDTSLNYIDGYKLTPSTSINPPYSQIAYNPIYNNLHTYVTSVNDFWVLPSDMSTPGTGTYVVNGHTYTKSPITTVSASSDTLTFTVTTSGRTAFTPTPVSLTLNSITTSDVFTFIGL